MLPVHRRVPPPRHRWRRAAGIATLAMIWGIFATQPARGAPRTPSAAPAAEVVAPAAVAARPILRLGSTGSAVVTLQRRLTALHYDVGPIDGVFGSSTFHGVVAFQKVNDLVRDGVVGPQTWARLDRPIVPRPRYSHVGTWVEVRLDKQVLFLARGTSVVRILDASSGKASTPTPVGNFRIIRRIDGWRISSLGRLWRPNYFYAGYAIHGYTSVPSYPASHGCVRVTIPAMNRLWSRLAIGMPVHVYRR